MEEEVVNMATAFALNVLLMVGVSIQDGFLPSRMTLEPQADKKARPGDKEWSSEVYLRYTNIGGSDGAGGKWSDDFDDGIGFQSS
jgi:hypothetical protein